MYSDVQFNESYKYEKSLIWGTWNHNMEIIWGIYIYKLIFKKRIAFFVYLYILPLILHFGLFNNFSFIFKFSSV